MTSDHCNRLRTLCVLYFQDTTKPYIPDITFKGHSRVPGLAKGAKGACSCLDIHLPVRLPVTDTQTDRRTDDVLPSF